MDIQLQLLRPDRQVSFSGNQQPPARNNNTVRNAFLGAAAGAGFGATPAGPGFISKAGNVVNKVVENTPEKIRKLAANPKFQAAAVFGSAGAVIAAAASKLSQSLENSGKVQPIEPENPYSRTIPEKLYKDWEAA